MKMLDAVLIGLARLMGVAIKWGKIALGALFVAVLLGGSILVVSGIGAIAGELFGFGWLWWLARIVGGVAGIAALVGLAKWRLNVLNAARRHAAEVEQRR